MKKQLLVCAVLALATLGAAHAAKEKTVFESKVLNTNPATGESRAEDFSMRLSGGISLNAPQALLNPSTDLSITGIKMQEATLSDGTGLRLIARDATYFPDKNELLSSSLLVVTSSARSGQNHYTCEDGNLLNHGDPVPGNMTCSQTGSGNSVVTTCVGNRVRTVISPSPEDCPVPPPES